jgi:NAD(P)-dependent dehydrogenase (short-subunit alcohol dehydrogenase family)
MARLQDKVALVTGATSGIGEATALVFAREGAQVVLVGRSEARGQALAERIGAQATFLRADVSEESEVARMIDTTVSRHGRLDVLFNNAGANAPGEVDNFTHEAFREAMDLLVGSVVHGMKFAAPVMKAQGGGAIINNTSVAARRAGLGYYLYSVAKAGVTHATKYAAATLGKHDIRVNCISPGAVVTPIFLGGGQAADRMEPGKRAHLLSKVEANLARQNPLQRAGLASDIANGALFLASDEGAYVNGHDLVMDGGMIVGGKLDYA